MNMQELVHPKCPNFKLYEIFKSSTANRRKIDNTTTNPVILSNAADLVSNILQPLRDVQKSPVVPQSWFRCQSLERIICWESFLGWAKDRNMHPNQSSWDKYFARKTHPLGGTVDLEMPGVMSNDELFEYIKTHFEFDQLIREFAVKGDPMSGWVHVSWAGVHNRNQVFSIP